jgi:hypothetical protein
VKLAIRNKKWWWQWLLQQLSITRFDMSGVFYFDWHGCPFLYTIGCPELLIVVQPFD